MSFNSHGTFMRNWHYLHFSEDDRFIVMKGHYQNDSSNTAELGLEPLVSSF